MSAVCNVIQFPPVMWQSLGCDYRYFFHAVSVFRSVCVSVSLSVCVCVCE